MFRLSLWWNRQCSPQDRQVRNHWRDARSVLLNYEAAINHECLARDVTGFIRRKEHDHVRNVLRLPDSTKRDRVCHALQFLGTQGMLLGQSLRGADYTRGDAVDPNAMSGEVYCEPADKANHSRLRGAVMGMIVPAIVAARDGGESHDGSTLTVDHAG